MNLKPSQYRLLMKGVPPAERRAKFEAMLPVIAYLHAGMGWPF